MEEMLPWGDLWNVDCKLKRENESSSNFIFLFLFHLKTTCKKILVSESGFIFLQRQEQFQT